MPARMRHKLARITGAIIHRILTAHLYVSAEWQRIDAVIRVALLETEQALAKANSELLHSHAQQFSHGIMAKFMDQHHEADDYDH